MGRRPNILFLQSSADLYGSSRSLLRTIAAIDDIVGDIYVILPGEGPLNQELEQLGAHVRVKNLGVLRKKYLNLLGVFNRLWYLINAIKYVISLKRRKDIKIIYSNTSVILVGAIVATISGCWHIQHFREIRTTDNLFKKVTAYVINKASDRVIYVSKAVENSWHDLIKRPLVSVIHNGIAFAPNSKTRDLRSELGLSYDSLLIGMIGRVHPLKGQLYFTEIASLLLKRYRLKAHFIMIGDPYPGYEYLLDEIENKKAQFQISNAVTNLGYYENPLPLISSLDLMILPSIEPDSFPTVILESMSLGVPVVSTQQGGAIEMLSEDCGLLIPVDNGEKSAELIMGLLSDSERLQKIRQNASNKFQERYTLDVFKKKMRDFFIEIMQRCA